MNDHIFEVYSYPGGAYGEKETHGYFKTEKGAEKWIKEAHPRAKKENIDWNREDEIPYFYRDIDEDGETVDCYWISKREVGE